MIASTFLAEPKRLKAPRRRAVWLRGMGTGAGHIAPFGRSFDAPDWATRWFPIAAVTDFPSDSLLRGSTSSRRGICPRQMQSPRQHALPASTPSPAPAAAVSTSLAALTVCVQDPVHGDQRLGDTLAGAATA